MVKLVTGESFQKEMKKAGTLSLVQFRKRWSGACQIIAPLYTELSKYYKGSASFFFADIEREKSFAGRYGIYEAPAILFFKDGVLIDHLIGLTSKNSLISKIEDALRMFKADTLLSSKI